MGCAVVDVTGVLIYYIVIILHGMDNVNVTVAQS